MPKSVEVGVAGLVEQDVARFDVAVDHADAVGGHQRAADLLDEAIDPLERPRPVAREGVGRRFAAQQPEHQVGAARLAPEVVERHDVGVLEAGHELRLGLEAADERGVVGQLGAR